MSEIVLHVGAHKSATSSIQEALREITKGDTSTVYLDATRMNDLQQSICRVANGNKEAPTEEEAAQAVIKFAKENSSADRIILSNENFLGTMLGIRWKFYSRSDSLRRIIDAVAAEYPVKVFLQSRETSSFLRSAYEFRVKFGMHLTYDQYLQQCDLENISWTKLGQTLFDGAGFDWRVLPIETLKDKDAQDYVQASVQFLYPTWDLARTPIPMANSNKSKLAHCIRLFVNRLQYKDVHQIEFNALDDIIGIEKQMRSKDVKRDEIAAKLRDVMKQNSFDLRLEECEQILKDFQYRRAGHNSLDRLMAAYFSDDYATFVNSYRFKGA